MNFNDVLILLREPLTGVFIGAILTGCFALWTETRRNTLNSNQYLKRKQEEFCLNAIDFLMDLRENIINAKNLLLLHQSPTTSKQNYNFEKVIPLLTLYTTPRMRKKFVQLSTKLLCGIYCEKEFWFFVKQFSYELGFNKKVFVIDCFKDMLEKFRIKKDNRITFIVFLIRIISEMQIVLKKDPQKIVYCKKFIHEVCQQAKGILPKKFLNEIENNITQLSPKSSAKQVKICLDNLAPKFEIQLKKLTQ